MRFLALAVTLMTLMNPERCEGQGCEIYKEYTPGASGERVVADVVWRVERTLGIILYGANTNIRNLLRRKRRKLLIIKHFIRGKRRLWNSI